MQHLDQQQMINKLSGKIAGTVTRAREVSILHWKLDG